MSTIVTYDDCTSLLVQQLDTYQKQRPGYEIVCSSEIKNTLVQILISLGYDAKLNVFGTISELYQKYSKSDLRVQAIVDVVLLYNISWLQLKEK